MAKRKGASCFHGLKANGYFLHCYPNLPCLRLARFVFFITYDSVTEKGERADRVLSDRGIGIYKEKLFIRQHLDRICMGGISDLEPRATNEGWVGRPIRNSLSGP